MSSAANPRRVAFGAFASWEERIRGGLQPRHVAAFVELASADLEAFDAVVPLQLDHYQTLEARRPDLYGRKFFFPTPPVASLCHDKLALTLTLIEKGFGAFTPALRKPGPPYPYVWKRRKSGYGRHCHVIANAEDERRFDLGDQDWFAQALASGARELATHVLRVKGTVRYLSTVLYEMAGPASVLGERHHAVACRLHPGAPFGDLFGQILEALDYEGTACFDYKIVDGRPAIFEINPRFGASLSNDVSTYLDAYLAALGEGGQG